MLVRRSQQEPETQRAHSLKLQLEIDKAEKETKSKVAQTQILHCWLVCRCYVLEEVICCTRISYTHVRLHIRTGGTAYREKEEGVDKGRQTSFVL